MASLDDLLAEVVANLDSDEPRLVFADALQSAGDLPTLAPSLQTLRALRLSPLGFDVERRRRHEQGQVSSLDPAVALAIGSQLPSLRVLSLTGLLEGPWISSMFCHGGLEQLAEVLVSLSQLGLRESEIESHHLAMLSQTPLFTRLRVLDLSANVGLGELFDLGASESLELIDLRGTPIGDISTLQQRCPNAEILTS